MPRYCHIDPNPSVCSNAKPLTIPTTMGLQSKAQDSPFLKLPAEIFLLISENVHPLERITLALTCKDALAKSLLQRLEVPSSFHHQAPWSRSSAIWLGFPEMDTGEPLCRCGGLEPLLRRLCPRNAAGHIDRTWKLCVDCMKYRPRRAGYWHAKRRVTGHVAHSAPEGAWKSAVKSFSTGYKSQCPSCRMRKRRSAVGTESEGEILPRKKKRRSHPSS